MVTKKIATCSVIKLEKKKKTPGAKNPSNIRIIIQENSNLTIIKQDKEEETELSKLIKEHTHKKKKKTPLWAKPQLRIV